MNDEQDERNAPAGLAVVVEALFARINEGHAAETAEHFTDDARMEIPYARQHEPAPGGPAIAAFLARVYADRFTGLRFAIDAVHPAAEAGLLFVEYRGQAQMRSTGLPYRNTYLGVFRVRDGRVALWREFYDPVEVLRAAGKFELSSSPQPPEKVSFHHANRVPASPREQDGARHRR